MSNQIHVFKVSDLLAACKADVSKVLIIENKREEKTYKQGSRFLNALFTVGNQVKKGGWFAVENVKLSKGLADPNDTKDKRNENEGKRSVETTVSKAGDFGAALTLINPDYSAKASQYAVNSRKLCELMQTKVSMESENVAARGQDIEDPIIRLKVDFGTWHEKFRPEFLAGTQVTVVYDFTKTYVDEKGVTQYKLATVVNDQGVEERINEANAHKFLKRGAIIRYGRVHMASVAVSKQFVSLPMMLTKVIVEPAPPEGFSDDDFTMPENLTAALTVGDNNTTGSGSTTTTTTDTTTTTTTTTTTEPSTTETATGTIEVDVTTAEINAFMDGL